MRISTVSPSGNGFAGRHVTSFCVCVTTLSRHSSSWDKASILRLDRHQSAQVAVTFNAMGAASGQSHSGGHGQATFVPCLLGTLRSVEGELPRGGGVDLALVGLFDGQRHAQRAVMDRRNRGDLKFAGHMNPRLHGQLDFHPVARLPFPAQLDEPGAVRFGVGHRTIDLHGETIAPAGDAQTQRKRDWTLWLDGERDAFPERIGGLGLEAYERAVPLADLGPADRAGAIEGPSQPVVPGRHPHVLDEIGHGFRAFGPGSRASPGDGTAILPLHIRRSVVISGRRNML